jgi:hypothetical protein
MVSSKSWDLDTDWGGGEVGRGGKMEIMCRFLARSVFYEVQ